MRGASGDSGNAFVGLSRGRPAGSKEPAKAFPSDSLTLGEGGVVGGGVRPVDIVVAMDLGRGIGYLGGLPWRLSGDLKVFRKVTESTQDPDKRNAVIMGRKTWESLPPAFQPLPNRLNVVLTHDPEKIGGSAVVCGSHSDADIQAAADAVSVFRPLVCSDLVIAYKLLDFYLARTVESVFIIGGGQLFDQVLGDPRLRYLYVTRILESVQTDVKFPEFESVADRESVSGIYQENGLSFRFERWVMHRYVAAHPNITHCPPPFS